MPYDEEIAASRGVTALHGPATGAGAGARSGGGGAHDDDGKGAPGIVRYGIYDLLFQLACQRQGQEANRDQVIKQRGASQFVTHGWCLRTIVEYHGPQY